MAKTVALVACVGKKADRPKPAGVLYESDWFRKASTYAISISDAWYILSAKYGLVAPDTVIAPYDQTLNKMPVRERRAWAKRVLQDLAAILEPGDRVAILAGQRYRADLVNPIRHMGCHVQIPMEGLKIGEQLRWLKQRIGR